MSNVTQGSIYGGLDLPFKNFGGSDIAIGTVVKLDASNPPTASALGGVAATAASTDVPCGVAISTIPAGGHGSVRVQGTAVVTAKGAITYADVLMPGSTSGTASTQTSAKAQLGMALATAADGDPCPVLIALAKNA